MEGNEIVVSEKAELATIKKKNPIKKILIILLSVFGIIGIILYILYATNIFFKIAPEKQLPAAYAKTYHLLENETSSFVKDYNENVKNSNVKLINNYTLNLFDMTFELTNYTGLSKGTLTLSDSTVVDFYIDDDSLIFSANGSEYYELNDLLDYILIADSGTVPSNILTTSFTNTDTSESNSETDSNDNSNSLYSYLFNDVEVNFYDDSTEVVKEYSKEEFLTLSHYVSSQANNEFLSFAINTSTKMLTFRCDKVYVTYTIDNKGRHRNVIKEISITTDRDNDKYIQLKSNSDKNLLDEFEINFKLLFSEHNYLINTNFNDYDGTLYLSLNNDTFDVTINSSESDITFNLGEDSFFKLSNDASIPTLPDEVYKISSNPIKFFFDMFGIDFGNDNHSETENNTQKGSDI